MSSLYRGLETLYGTIDGTTSGHLVNIRISTAFEKCQSIHTAIHAINDPGGSDSTARRSWVNLETNAGPDLRSCPIVRLASASFVFTSGRVSNFCDRIARHDSSLLLLYYLQVPTTQSPPGPDGALKPQILPYLRSHMYRSLCQAGCVHACMHIRTCTHAYMHTCIHTEHTRWRWRERQLHLRLGFTPLGCCARIDGGYRTENSEPLTSMLWVLVMGEGDEGGRQAGPRVTERNWSNRTGQKDVKGSVFPNSPATSQTATTKTTPTRCHGATAPPVHQLSSIVTTANHSRRTHRIMFPRSKSSRLTTWLVELNGLLMGSSSGQYHSMHERRGWWDVR